jgi:osmotically-inducible protein OsmY
VAIVIGWATLVFIGLAFLFGDPLVTGLTHLSTKLPLYVREAADGTGPIGQLVRRFHLQTWVAQNSPKLKSLGDDPGQARAGLRQGRGVGARDAGDDLRARPPADARGAEDMVGAAELAVTRAGGAVVPGGARTAAELAVSGLIGVRNVKDEIVINFSDDPGDVTLLVQDALDRNALILDDSDVEVDTAGGTVTLTGHVRTWAEHDAAIGAPWMANGVSEVIDYLVVTG